MGNNQQYIYSKYIRALFHNNLIWLRFSPNIFHAKVYIFQTILSGMFKAEYIV